MARRLQRLSEIHQRNVRDIAEPFEYQTRLLDQEVDDVIVSMTEATNDASDAFNDMLERLDRLHADKIVLFNNEATLVNDTMVRSVVDRKNPCNVLHALRVDFIKNITCDEDRILALDNLLPVFDAASATADGSWRVYEGLFDDFHYDIGHGKGHGTGDVDSDLVVDGFGQGSARGGARGDS